MIADNLGRLKIDNFKIMNTSQFGAYFKNTEYSNEGVSVENSIFYGYDPDYSSKNKLWAW